VAEPVLASATPTPQQEGFDIPKEILEVPSFLRES
jgi:hypothetical protein